MSDQPLYFELQFKPSVMLVSVVRRFVNDFYSEFLGDPDGTSRVALATHELLENAVKYSVDGATTVWIEVAAREQGNSGGREVRIGLRNRSDAANIANVERVVAEIREIGDAFAAYQKLMMQAAKTKDRFGLGIARICAEGEMEMDCKIEGNEVTLEATTTVEGGAA